LNPRAFSTKLPTSNVVPDGTLPSVLVGSTPLKVTRIVTAGSESVIVTSVPGAYVPPVRLSDGAAATIVYVPEVSALVV